MADNKSYYYLKLKDDFFDSSEIKVLEKMENGYKYSNILLKMYLKSIKRDGLLVFNDRIPYNADMISAVTNHNINDVKQALVLFQDMGLIEVLSDGAIYMLDIQNYIGKSSSEADRIRAFRKNIEEKRKKLLGKCKLVTPTDTKEIVQMYDKCTPKIEIEIEKDIEKDINSPVEKKPYKPIVDFLNDKCGTHYRHNTDKTKESINARINEGFTVQDFEVVIEKKADEWTGTKYEKYLRPQTLFGTKFESYLNQNIVKEKKDSDNGNVFLEMMEEEEWKWIKSQRLIKN